MPATTVTLSYNPGGMGFDEWVVGLNFFDNDPYLSRNGTVEHFQGKGSVILMDEALAFLRKHKDRPTHQLEGRIDFPASTSDMMPTLPAMADVQTNLPTRSMVRNTSSTTWLRIRWSKRTFRKTKTTAAASKKCKENWPIGSARSFGV